MLKKFEVDQKIIKSPPDLQLLLSEDSAPWQYLRHWRRKFESHRVRYAATQGDERQRGSRNARLKGGRSSRPQKKPEKNFSRWLFQIFFIFTPIRGRFPI